MFTEAKQAYFSPGYTFLEEPINFKLSLAYLSFLPICCFIGSNISSWIQRTFMSI